MTDPVAFLETLRDNPDALNMTTALTLERLARAVEREHETLGIDELIERYRKVST